jgi:hypothetical protein
VFTPFSRVPFTLPPNANAEHRARYERSSMKKRPRTKHATWAGATPPFGSLSRPKGSWGRSRPRAQIPCQMFCPREEKFRNQPRKYLERRISMSFIKRPPETITREFQLEEPLAQTLDSYAKFIGSTPDHVVASALRFVFWKDKDFDRLQKEEKKARRTAQNAWVKKA